ncbi:MAG: spermidine synthase [Myxococcales bacterium]|nr:spermidine synthase [Myxococcales bacterium]
MHDETHPAGDTPAPSRSHPGTLLLLGVMFTLTGGSALVVEQVFEKFLSTVVGASTPAATVVLSVFFAGLFAGGLLYKRLRRRAGNPLRLYALLEGGVGLFALLLAFTFGWAQEISSRIVALGGENAPAVFVLRLLVAAVWILPPTLAMGATFPAVAGVLREAGLPETTQKRLTSRFYSQNLLGAVAGSFLAPYLMFPWLGLTGTLLLLAGVQLAVGVAAGWLARRRPTDPQDAAALPDLARSLRGLWAHPARRLLMLISLTSGFVIFSTEVVWIHLIGVVLGMSVYAFAVMLGVVLLGLFIGSFVVASLRRHEHLAEGLMIFLLCAAGLCGLLFASLWDRAPLLLLSWGQEVAGFWDGELLRLAAAFLLMLLPAVLLGMVYPLIFRLPAFPAQDADGAAGVLGAINAAGSILGALLTGFVLIPALGSENTLISLALIPILIGLALGARMLRAGPRLRLGALLALGAALPGLWIAVRPAWDRLLLTSGINVYFAPLHVTARSRLRFFHEDTYGGITTVVENPIQRGVERVLLTNGKFQGNDANEAAAQIGIALVPTLLAAELDEALVVGLGTGHSAAILRAAGVRHLEIAEISPGIVQASREHFADINDGLLTRADVHLVLEDGRNHLLRTDRRYSLVSMELSSVWFAGVSNLYSREFYRLVRTRLRPGGVFQQWVQLHHMGVPEFLSMVATLREEFPYVSLWLLGGQGVLAASEGPQSIPAGRRETLAARAEMAPHLTRLQEITGFTLADIEGGRLLDPDDVDRLARAARERKLPLNSDGNRFLEYATPRYNLVRRDTRRDILRALLEFVPPELRLERAGKVGLPLEP